MLKPRQRKESANWNAINPYGGVDAIVRSGISFLHEPDFIDWMISLTKELRTLIEGWFIDSKVIGSKVHPY